MKSKRFTTRDKILMVPEFFETDIEMADLCRKHDLNPSTFSKWKMWFFFWWKQEACGGRGSIGSGPAPS